MFNQNKLVSLFLFIILWQTLSILIDSSVFPSVIDILTNLAKDIVDGELFKHLSITLQRVFIAFFITMIIGISIGVLMGIYKKIDDFFDFILILALNIPALVTIVVCYIWFGLTDIAALLAVIINKIPIVVVNIREGTRAVNKDYFDLARVYEVSKKETFFKVFLPQLYPYIMASTRLTLSLVWKIVLVVELLGRSDGIGFKISMFFQFFDITSIFAYSLAFVLVILLIEHYVLKPIDNKIKAWK